MEEEILKVAFGGLSYGTLSKFIAYETAAGERPYAAVISRKQLEARGRDAEQKYRYAAWAARRQLAWGGLDCRLCTTSPPGFPALHDLLPRETT